MFINYRQEQWSDWLETAEFVYNNKMHSSTKISPFKANYRQDSRMEFEVRRKGKYKGIEKFVTQMKEIQEEAKAALEKAQEEIKRYTDKKRAKINEYRIGNLMMLSTKDLKYQMVSRRTEKLTEKFIGSYKIKKVISLNAVELELSSIVYHKLHSDHNSGNT